MSIEEDPTYKDAIEYKQIYPLRRVFYGEIFASPELEDFFTVVVGDELPDGSTIYVRGRRPVSRGRLYRVTVEEVPE